MYYVINFWFFWECDAVVKTTDLLPFFIPCFSSTSLRYFNIIIYNQIRKKKRVTAALRRPYHARDLTPFYLTPDDVRAHPDYVASWSCDEKWVVCILLWSSEHLWWQREIFNARHPQFEALLLRCRQLNFRKMKSNNWIETNNFTSEFAIFLSLPHGRNVRMTLKWHIWLVIDSWSLTAPIRTSVRGRMEFCKITMTSDRFNLHSPTPLPIFDRRPRPWYKFISLPSLSLPLK